MVSSHVGCGDPQIHCKTCISVIVGERICVQRCIGVEGFSLVVGAGEEAEVNRVGGSWFRVTLTLEASAGMGGRGCIETE
jgi:hypothetical protein